MVMSAETVWFCLNSKLVTKCDEGDIQRREQEDQNNNQRQHK